MRTASAVELQLQETDMSTWTTQKQLNKRFNSSGCQDDWFFVFGFTRLLHGRAGSILLVESWR